MSVYKQFCNEITDEQGNLKKITLEYPAGFNFGYDVVDKIAEQSPDKRAMVWCNVEGEEHIFSFDDIKRNSNRIANVFIKAGIAKGDRVMLILKRHYEYWFAAIALHKLGAVMVPATHMLTVSDFVYRIKASGVKGIVCTTQDEVPEKILSALKESGMTAKLSNYIRFMEEARMNYLKEIGYPTRNTKAMQSLIRHTSPTALPKRSRSSRSG